MNETKQFPRNGRKPADVVDAYLTRWVDLLKHNPSTGAIFFAEISNNNYWGRAGDLGT